jgi:hypothetical protein
VGVRVPPSAYPSCNYHQINHLQLVPNPSLGTLALYRHQRHLVSKILLDHDPFHGVGFHQSVSIIERLSRAAKHINNANWKFRFEGVVEKVSSQARSVADDVGAGREGAHGIGMMAILYDDNCAALHCVGCDQNHWAGKYLRVVRSAPRFVRFLDRKLSFGDESHGDIFQIQGTEAELRKGVQLPETSSSYPANFSAFHFPLRSPAQPC